MSLKQSVARLSCGLVLTHLMAAATVAVVAAPTAVQAQTCDTTLTNVSFGNAAVLSTLPINVSAIMSTSCSGIPSNRPPVRMCLYLAGDNTTRAMTSGANSLRYGIFRDAGRTQPWNDTGVGPPPLFVTHSNNVGNASQPVYFQIVGGQQATPPGLYSYAYAGVALASVSADFQTSTTCPATPPGAVGSIPTVNVTATVPKECRLDMINLNFGTRGVLSSNVNALQSSYVTCSGTTPWSFSVDNGQNGSSSTTRRMRLGSDYISYNLFSDSARTAVLGSTAGQTLSGVGNGNWQLNIIYGRIPPQPTPPPGVYTDTIVGTISY